MVLSLMSILVPVLLASLRDMSIGIDTSSYYNGTWMRVYSTDMSLFQFLSYYSGISRERAEYGFILLQYIVAKTTGSYNVFLFAVHFIIITCVYVGAFRMKEHAEPEITLLLFYLLYYNHSLNIYRQYIAMSIVFAALSNLEKGKHLRYLIVVLVGYTFHNTCLLGILPLVLYRVLYRERSGKSTSQMRKVMVWILIIGIVASFIPLVQFLISRGIISRKYLYYINVDSSSQHTMVLLFLAVELVGLVLYWRQFHTKDEHSDFYIYSYFTFVFLYILAATIIYGKRIAAYFSMLNILTLGILIRCQSSFRQKKTMRFLVICVAFVYWAYVYAYRNSSHTIPYKLFF